MRLQNKFVLLLSISAHIILYLMVGARLNTGSIQSRQPITVQLRESDGSHNRLLPQPAIAKNELQALDHGQASIRPSDQSTLTQEQRHGIPSLPVPREIEPYYFRIKELTERPHVLQDAPSQITIIDPSVARQMLVLRLLINEFGDVDKVMLEKLSLPKMTEEIMLAPFYRMKFQPGWIGEMPVKSQILIEVELQPNEDKTLLPVH